MQENTRKKRYFTGTEMLLFCCSEFLTVLTFLIFDRTHYLTLTASLIGAASLVLNAKGNPLGQLLMVIFSVMYGIISMRQAYYGEMLTYLGMTGPMALFSLISWLRNPFQGKRSEVAVNRLSRKEALLCIPLTAAVTAAFYLILRHFHTALLPLSTLSVATSFLAVYLTFRRSAQYALAYAANDIVLIVLWTAAARQTPSYCSVVMCFLIFLANDLYGYVSWQRMKTKQVQQNVR